ncbi:MAG: 4Fe-4S dicluster domain-containing protein [Anaerolineae bacterium]|nr:4Fe-4S dicluster domain-containing protein [Anaerolineae bacterium]
MVATDIYQKLAHYLDDLPGGFPATSSGVELRILRRLFTPEEAELALKLSLLEEEPRVIARRAGMPVEETARLLEQMAGKGLIYRTQPKGRPPRYMASQFVVGIWEFHVNSLDAELVRDFDEYLPTLAAFDVWKKAPQLRTIPVGESIDAELTVLPYERAEEMVRSQSRIAVAPCICRREQRMAGHGCDKPLETCLVFGGAADYYLHNGLGRAISQQEALLVLKQANEAGLVLQPGNSKRAGNICACCGCCCGVLRRMKHHPAPASLFASPFVAAIDPATCLGCGTCLDRCQMEALRLEEGKAILDLDRCIGCGLCVSTCPTGSLRLVRKPESAQPYIPRNSAEAAIRLGRSRGKMTIARMIGMLVRSGVDRLLASR